MRKIFTLVAIIFCCAQLVLAQELSHEFGVISKNEFDFTAYEKDPDAEAVIIFDKGESYFFDTHESYDIRFTRAKRIKILSRAGIDQAEITIPFYAESYEKTEKIASLQAFSYNMVDGRIFKKALDPSKVYEVKINDRWKAKRFAFPDVKEGTVIEYKYVLETPFHFNLPDWKFQDRIPTLYSEYIIKLIPFYEYEFLAQGIRRFDFHESKEDTKTRSWGAVSKIYGSNVGSGFEFKDMIHTYVMKDMPAFRDETYITSPEDYLAKIDFQLSRFHNPGGVSKTIITTWPELTKDLLKHQNFGKYTKSAERLAKKLLETELPLDQENELEKAKQIIEYVKASFSWDGYNTKFASKNPKEVLKQKTGTAAELNLFMAGMLQAAGIKAHPVIISTRDHGQIKTSYPFHHFFNYVIVLVELGNQSFLADGTENLIAFSRIPPRCINGKGLVIKEQKDTEATWIDLYSNILSLDSKRINLSLDAGNLTASTVVTVQSTEFEALVYRNKFKNDSIRLKEFLLENGFQDISRIKTFNYDKTNAPYTLAYEGITPLEKIDNKLIVSPFLNFPIKENKLTQKKRTYPVDFIYAKKEDLVAIIDIPDGYKVVSIPEAYVLDNHLAEINLTYSINDRIIEATANYHFKKGLYTTEEYARIKYYLDMIVKKFNEQVVLEEI